MIRNIFNLFGLLVPSTPYLRGIKYCEKIVQQSCVEAADEEYELYTYGDRHPFDRGYADALTHFSKVQQ